MNISKFLIYVLKDPQTDEVRYVGKSTTGMRRPNQHFTKSSLERNNRKNNWIKKLQSQDKKPTIEILEFHNSSETLDESEQFYISYLRWLGCDLTNLTDGGEGTYGYNHKNESIQRMREKALERGPHGRTPHNKSQHIFEDGVEKRQCKKCETHKPIDDFSFYKKKKRFYASCKRCEADRMAKRHNEGYTNYVKLSPEEYKESRISAAKKGGLAMTDTPEKRAAISKRNSKPIIAISATTGEILEFTSALKAKEQGFHNKLIGDAIKSKRPYKGYYWKLAVKEEMSEMV